MSLFNSQTIFNILITLIICSAMFMFFRFKLRILEISQTEQAKVLQSLVMNMRNTHLQSMISDEEITKHVKMQMQMQQSGGSGVGSTNHYSRSNDLIDVSDEEDDEEDDDDSSESDSDSGSESSSDSGDDDDDDGETHDNTTKKIIFNNGGHLDSQMVEHLTGDDVKVIELTEPLYPMGSSSSSKHDTDTNHASDGDDGDDDEDASDDDNDNDNDNDDDETSDDTEVKIEELPSHASLSLQQEHQHLATSVVDATEIKTIFKADKQQHTDYNSMNVQALKQHLKTKLSAEGMQYNETAINKLNKKELIKHLTQ